MANQADIDRIMSERTMDEGTLPTAHLKLITRLKEELRGEMVGIVQRRVGLKDVEVWLRKKHSYYDAILARENVKPATKMYTLIKQIDDVVIHFVAEYRITSAYERRAS
jgi:hypothetical protein